MQLRLLVITMANGKPTWNSRVGLYGRYILTMQIEIVFDESRTSVVTFGDPQFTLEEIKRITKQDGGVLGAVMGDSCPIR